MESEPEPVPPTRRRPIWCAFVFGAAGLVLVNGAADELLHHRLGLTPWLLLLSGAAFLVLALGWAAGRRPKV